MAGMGQEQQGPQPANCLEKAEAEIAPPGLGSQGYGRGPVPARPKARNNQLATGKEEGPASSSDPCELGLTITNPPPHTHTAKTITSPPGSVPLSRPSSQWKTGNIQLTI